MSLIQGPPLLRKRVADYLSSAMPQVINVARIQWGLTGFQLPNPDKYDAYDPYLVGPDESVTIGMYAVSDRDHVHRDVNDSAEREYWSLYSCRLFASVLTPKDEAGEFVVDRPFEATVDLRDRMISIIKNALLNSPSLGGFDMEVLEETISTEYDDPMPINDKYRSVFRAAAVLNVEIRMTESLYLEPLGQVETTHVQIERVPDGEPL